MKIATYKCHCGHKWEAEVEGGTMPLKHNKVHSDKCPACGSIYFAWTNYISSFVGRPS